MRRWSQWTWIDGPWRGQQRPRSLRASSLPLRALFSLLSSLSFSIRLPSLVSGRQHAAQSCLLFPHLHILFSFSRCIGTLCFLLVLRFHCRLLRYPYPPANFITSPLFFVLSPVVFRRIPHRRERAIPGAAHEVSTARVCQSFKPPPPSLEYLLLTLRTVLE